MKSLGIVGSEAAKFTAKTEAKARDVIREFITRFKADRVVSGGCHLGGIDIWAVEEARAMGLEVLEHIPRELSWSAEGGYRDRNLAIANDSHGVVCITVRDLPPDYTGMRFPFCYHCGPKANHVKSGGCWTVKAAVKMGKKGVIVTV